MSREVGDTQTYYRVLEWEGESSGVELVKADIQLARQLALELAGLAMWECPGLYVARAMRPGPGCARWWWLYPWG